MKGGHVVGDDLSKQLFSQNILGTSFDHFKNEKMNLHRWIWWSGANGRDLM